MRTHIPAIRWKSLTKKEKTLRLPTFRDRLLMSSPNIDKKSQSSEHWGVSSTEISAFSDLELFTHCSAGKDHLYWNEFFRRFIPIIKWTIKNTVGSLANDEDVVWDIHEKLVRMLYNEDLLSMCTDPSGLRPWLKTVTKHLALDWLVAKGRKKNLSREQLERDTVSIFGPVGISNNGDEIQLIDTITDTSSPSPDKNLIFQLEKTFLEIAQEQLDLMRHGTKPVEIRNYWVLRLSILSQLPLTPDELDELVQYSPLLDAEAFQKLQDISQDLRSRGVKRDAKIGRAQELFSELRELEKQLRWYFSDDTASGIKTRQSLEKQLKKVIRLRNERLAEGLKIPRPSNRGIAELVGIPTDQSDQISKILERQREKLLGLTSREIERTCQQPE
jgi:DNA-directed RNA polymerase specialized sigma24 family protein